MNMAEVVSKIGVRREGGYLYFLRGSDVWKTPMKRAGGPAVEGKAEKVASGDFKREDGYLYFHDRNGNVARAKRAVGGQKRKKKARTAAKKATAKKPAKKAAKKPAKKAAKKPAKKGGAKRK